MAMENLQTQLEALLFVSGEEGISLEELAFLVDEPTSVVFRGVEILKLRYDEGDGALNILEVGNHYLLTTKKECAFLLKKFAQSPMSNHLSQAALETLSIIAYKQPVTRIEVDEIRGVQSSGSVQKLVARQLIEEKSRVDGPGRAILYGTTKYFMDYFGLKTIQDLPSINQLEEDVEQEMSSDLFFDRFKNQLEAVEINQNDKSEESV